MLLKKKKITNNKHSKTTFIFLAFSHMYFSVRMGFQGKDVMQLRQQAAVKKQNAVAII